MWILQYVNISKQECFSVEGQPPVLQPDPLGKGSLYGRSPYGPRGGGDSSEQV